MLMFLSAYKTKINCIYLLYLYNLQSLSPPPNFSSECTKEDLVTYLTANNVPLCESEMTDYAEFMSGRDGDASILSLADMHATFESAGGNNVPGTRNPKIAGIR